MIYRTVLLTTEGVLCPSRWDRLAVRLRTALAQRGQEVGERALARAAAGVDRRARPRRGPARFSADWTEALLERLGCGDAQLGRRAALPPPGESDLYPDVRPALEGLRERGVRLVVVAFAGDPPPRAVTGGLGIGALLDALVEPEGTEGDAMSGHGTLLIALQALAARPEQTALVTADPAAVHSAAACRVRAVRVERSFAGPATAEIIRSLEELVLALSTEPAAARGLL